MISRHSGQLSCADSSHAAAQVYFDLAEMRKQQGKEKEIAIVRIEQLAPFPFDLVGRELRRYPNAEVMWCASNILQASLALSGPTASELPSVPQPARSGLQASCATTAPPKAAARVGLQMMQ